MNEIEERIAKLAKAAKIDGWNSFVEEMQLPNELAVALLTGRPEMLKAIQPRALTPDEHAIYLKLFEALMQTNDALRTHAADVAKLTNSWMGHFKGLARVAEQINTYAMFRHDLLEEVEEEA
jgi:hypothetical protein